MTLAVSAAATITGQSRVGVRSRMANKIPLDSQMLATLPPPAVKAMPP